MKFTRADGTIPKGRRELSGVSSIHDDDDPKKLIENLKQLSARVAALEAVTQRAVAEFEVVVSTAGAIVEINHGFGTPVRWWVTDWSTNQLSVPITAPVGGHSLVRSTTSDNDVLRLASYVAGKAVIRIESSQSGV